MRKHRVICHRALHRAWGLAVGALLSSDALGQGPKPSKKKAIPVQTLFHNGPVSVRGRSRGRSPPPTRSLKNVVPRTMPEQLGKDLLYDFTLSNPQATPRLRHCAPSHSPDTGYTWAELVRSNEAGCPQPGYHPRSLRAPQASILRLRHVK